MEKKSLMYFILLYVELCQLLNHMSSETKDKPNYKVLMKKKKSMLSLLKISL